MRRACTLLATTVLALSTWPLWSCADPGPTAGTSFETENTVTGRVVDSTGRGLPHATVRIRPYWYVRSGADAAPDANSGILDLVADASGRFRASGLPAGEFRLEAVGQTLSCFVAARFDSGHRTAPLGEVVAKPAATLSGRISLPQGASRVRVQFYGMEKDVLTDSQGRFHVHLPSGDIRVRGIVPGTARSLGEAEVALAPAASARLDTLVVGAEDPATWRHGQWIGLDPTASGAPASGGARDLPVLVRLDGARFPGGSGSDLRILDQDGRALDFETGVWDAAAAIARIWIRIDTLAARDTTRRILLLWGRDGALTHSSPAQVFDTSRGWSGVWHLSSTASDGAGRRISPDATAWRQDGVVRGPGGHGEGVVGLGHRFDGISDVIRIGGASTEIGARSFTLELWVRPDRIGATLLKKGASFFDTGMKEIALRGGDSDVHARGWSPTLSSRSSSANYAVGGAALPSGRWSHLALRWRLVSAGMGRADWFLNGRLLSGSNWVPVAADRPGDSLALGIPVDEATGDSLRLQGWLDEVRILREARSDDWLRMSHAAQAPESGFVRFLSRW